MYKNIFPLFLMINISCNLFIKAQESKKQITKASVEVQYENLINSLVDNLPKRSEEALVCLSQLANGQKVTSKYGRAIITANREVWPLLFDSKQECTCLLQKISKKYEIHNWENIVFEVPCKGSIERLNEWMLECDINNNRSKTLLFKIAYFNIKGVKLFKNVVTQINPVERSTFFNSLAFVATKSGNLYFLKSLIEHYAINVNLSHKQDSNTLLSFASYYHQAAIVDYLLQSGANPNTFNKHEKTPLMNAVENGDVSCIKLLLQYDADILVLQDHQIKYIASLIEKKLLIPSALKCARHGDLTGLKRLYPYLPEFKNIGDTAGNTLLHIALQSNACFKKDEMVSYLLEKELNVNKDNVLTHILAAIYTANYSLFRVLLIEYCDSLLQDIQSIKKVAKEQFEITNDENKLDHLHSILCNCINAERFSLQQVNMYSSHS